MATIGNALSQVPSLFDRYELQAIFSAQNIEGQQFTIHLYLGQDKKIGIIVDHMNKLGKCNELINLKYSEHKLTALHIAVLKGNIKGVIELCKRGADVEAQDAYGWTPWVHTALLVNYKFIKEHLEKNRAKTDEDLWKRLRVRSGFDTSTLSLNSLYVKEGSRLSIIKPKALKKHTTLDQYSDEIIFDHSNHVYLWKLPSLDYRLEREAIIELGHRLREKKTAKVCICSVEPMPDNARNLGLYNMEALQKGDPIGVYTGKVEPYPEKVPLSFFEDQVLGRGPDTAYNLSLTNNLTINALNVGNSTRFANDGWPNVAVQKFYGQYLYMFSLEKINAENELTWDYGPGCPSLKWGHYIVTKTSQMHAYFSICSPNKMVDLHRRFVKELIDAKDIGKKVNAYLYLVEYAEKLKYLYSTPAVLIHLSLAGDINPQDLLDLLKSESLLRDSLGLNDHRPHYMWVIAVLFLLRKFNLLSSSLSIGIANSIKEYLLLNIMNRFSVPQIIIGIYYLNDYLEKNCSNFSYESWEKFQPTLLKSVTEYQWNINTDPVCSMGRELRFEKEVDDFIREIGLNP